MQTITVCGLMVVRLPTRNFDSQERSAFKSRSLPSGFPHYAGIDRMPWFDVEENLSDSPHSIQSAFTAIREAGNDFTGLDVSQNLSSAKELLAYANRDAEQNELIAISSPMLLELKGGIQVPEKTMTWLGFDVVAFGQWSLLHDGLYAKPAAFGSWPSFLNVHGLLSSMHQVEALIRDYSGLEKSGAVECLGEDVCSIEAVGVWRISV